MYTKGEASQLRQAFWTAFGQYIAPHPSDEGLKVNWINYNTGFKSVYFRMQADSRKASIGIELSHADVEIQQMFFEQFLALKNVLHQILGEEWRWLLHTKDQKNKTFSRIYKELSPVNIFNKDEWPDLISFFKPRIIALDEFWIDAKYSFENLR
ncbi:hypothetical protein BH23BAC1_BH23BAC1_38960 [soil metagenome]